jgi:TatD DNase family protein
VIDTHCHLTHGKFVDEVDAVVARARDAGVAACVTIGTGVEDATEARALKLRFPGFVFCTAGIDPFNSHRLGSGFDAEFRALEILLENGGFVGVGEIGLDYHYDLDPPLVQASRLELQLDLAVRLHLPVVIHVREAHEDMIAVLAKHPRNVGVIHSFTAGPREAERYLELGWYLAFNGVVTFKNAEDVREALRLTPEDRLLVETDSPYLAPVPQRGRRCEPALIRHTYDRIAAERGDDLKDLVRSTTRNSVRLLGLHRQGLDSMPV